MVGIVLLAMVAAFLAMRLYAVLGKRTGHEQTFVAPVERPLRAVAPIAEEPTGAPAITADSGVEPAAAAGVRAIAAADGGFDPARFVEGAKGAYRMILEAFWRADEDALSPLTSAEVREAFATAIADRKTAGHVLDNRLVVVERAVITEARLNNRMAEVTVRFESDMSLVTRDGAGAVAAGSLSDAVQVIDVWTFAREVRSSDPNWLLIDTDESR